MTAHGFLRIAARFRAAFPLQRGGWERQLTKPRLHSSTPRSVVEILQQPRCAAIFFRAPTRLRFRAAQ
jgi:hypothetical protein